MEGAVDLEEDVWMDAELAFLTRVGARSDETGTGSASCPTCSELASSLS